MTLGRHFLTVIALGTVFLMGIGLARTWNSDAAPAASIKGVDIRATLNEDGDFRVQGSDVALSGKVDGHLFVRTAEFAATDLSTRTMETYATEVDLQGDIDGDLVLHATHLASTADISGPLEIHTRGLAMSGHVTGPVQVSMIDGHLDGRFSSVTLRGNDVAFRQAARIGRLDVSARDVSIDGTVEGPLAASVRSVRIGGVVSDRAEINAHPGVVPDEQRDGYVEIAGRMSDVRICADRVVVSGTVAGQLVVSANEPPRFEAQGQATEVRYLPRRDGRCVWS